MKKSLRIGLIGAGNLAWNLCGAFNGLEGFEIVQVISRSEASLQKLATHFYIPNSGTDFSLLDKNLDLVFIATNDHAISEVAGSLATHAGDQTVFVHSSGSVGLEALKPLFPRAGVFYPLQTFTREHLADFSSIPLFLEGDGKVLAMLNEIAALLSEKVYVLDSDERRKLHLGAVFACNFPNLMWMITEELLSGMKGVNIDVYEPLVHETVEKVFKYGALSAQTGPAKRGDSSTMNMHANALERESPELKKLYKMLSDLISDRFDQPG